MLREMRRRHLRAPRRLPARWCLRPSRAAQFPRAIARRLVLEKNPRFRRRSRTCVIRAARFDRQPRLFELRAQRRPIETEIGADARVARNADVVVEQKPIDWAHQRAMAWNPPSTMSSSPVMNEPALSLASSSVAPISSRASPNRSIGVCAMILAMRSG